MVLADTFVTPLGLAAAAAALPLVVLYLVQPDPRRMALPTVRFLTDDDDEGGSNPVLERLRRNLLLLIQLLAVALLAVSLASPYVTTTRAASEQATVVVVDASASMATETGEGTRFQRAIDTAASEVGSPTTVVTAGASTGVAVGDATRPEARAALSDLTVTDAPGDLGGAIRRASSLAEPGSRLVVVSDFATEGDWRAAVDTARAAGVDVSLEPVGGGGERNVGIVDRQFDGNRLVLTVKNTGTEPAERTLSLAGRSRELSLRPGDVATRSFPVPAETATARLSPADSFPTDDAVTVAVPPDPTVDVLLLTNGDDRELRTALSVVDTVDLTVERPPAAVDDPTSYDVVVFADVDGERVLRSTLSAAREVRADGGGVVVQAQDDTDAVGYGDLLPVETAGVESETAVATVNDHPLTRGFEFPEPERHLRTGAVEGSTLVAARDGSPMLVAAADGPGRVLYYGYFPDEPAFRYSYRYPVFWKRASHWLADRPSLDELNYRTGGTVALGTERTVETPTGTRTVTALRLDAGGRYRAGDRELSASLLSVAESNVTAPRLGDEGATDPATAAERVQQDLTPLAVLAVLLVALGELGFLRYRGDI